MAHFTDIILQSMDAVRLLCFSWTYLRPSTRWITHLLLQKLTNIGLTTSTTQWFNRSCLTNRSQITSIGDAHSSCCSFQYARWGTPWQYFGAATFFIYVNDLPDRHLSSDVILYADDTVIYYSSKNLSDLEDHIDADLGTVSEQFSRNLLTLNISKRNFCN